MKTVCSYVKESMGKYDEGNKPIAALLTLVELLSSEGARRPMHDKPRAMLYLKTPAVEKSGLVVYHSFPPITETSSAEVHMSKDLRETLEPYADVVEFWLGEFAPWIYVPRTNHLSA